MEQKSEKPTQLDSPWATLDYLCRHNTTVF